MNTLSFFSSPPLEANSLPLQRFLPPLGPGIDLSYLQKQLPPGSWLLDPFGASPQLPIDAAKAGFRVLVTANHPVARFLLTALANPPTSADLRQLLARLSSARVDEERLEPHLLNLYMTTCEVCGEKLSADVFLWEKETDVPFGRVVNCSTCGELHEFATTEEDIALLARFSKESGAVRFNRARALSSLVTLDDPDRKYLEEALDAYPPRSLYAIFTILNKVQSLNLSPAEKFLADALLIPILDQCNHLWLHPTERERPKQLITPARYREQNVWRALESSLDLWESLTGTSTPLTFWPDLPPETGGICVFADRAKDLRKVFAQTADPPQFEAVLTALPRPNQAYWTLSALWSGWLWGPESLEPFRALLRRERFDWRWHTAALQSVFGHARALLPAGKPFYALIPEAETGLISAVFLAANQVGLVVSGTAVRHEDREVHAVWLPGMSSSTHEGPAHLALDNGFKEVSEALGLRAQPASHLYIQTAFLAGLSHTGSFPAPEATAGLTFSTLTSWVEDLFEQRDLQAYGEGSPFYQQWWQPSLVPSSPPIAEQVESKVSGILAKSNPAGVTVADMEVCRLFPGYKTPHRALVKACLESYRRQLPDGLWTLREEDLSHVRQQDMQEIKGILTQLGKSLGYQIEHRPALTWVDGGGVPQAVFKVQVTAHLTDAMTYPPEVPGKAYIVLPGSRSGLLAYNLETNPLTADVTRIGWKFLTFRVVRHLRDNPSAEVDIGELDAIDPITAPSTQLRLF